MLKTLKTNVEDSSPGHEGGAGGTAAAGSSAAHGQWHGSTGGVTAVGGGGPAGGGATGAGADASGLGVYGINGCDFFTKGGEAEI